MRELWKQTQIAVCCMVVALATIASIFTAPSANAAQITDRSLTLVAGDGGDGGSLAGGDVKHEFTFTIPSATSVASIKFEYCTIASGTCDMPTDLVTTGATLDAESGDVTGWTVDNTTNGAPYAFKAAGSFAGTSTLRLANITNPTADNTSFFVRMTTHVANDGTGASVDAGVVTASTATAIELTGVMPESLIFCTGETVTANCTSTTPGAVSFNQLFSPTDTATATSQMAASTNAGNGYVITVNGETLTSGSNTIPAMTAGAGTSVVPVRGTSQFGMNFRANTVAVADSFPGDSADITPTSDGGDLRGQVLAGYDTVDEFRFVTSEVVTDSAFASPGPTNSQVYTASYIVNVAGNQLAGTYTTTLTYICTPTF